MLKSCGIPFEVVNVDALKYAKDNFGGQVISVFHVLRRRRRDLISARAMNKSAPRTMQHLGHQRDVLLRSRLRIRHICEV
jgi:hypothetical protein